MILGSTTSASTRIKFSKFLLLLTFLCFTSSLINAQNDSLRIENLYSLAYKNKRTKPKLSIAIFENTINIINDSILPKNENNNYFLLKKAIMLDNLGFYYRKGKEYSKSLSTLYESLKIKKEIGETYSICHTYRLLGRLYLNKNDSLKSRQYNDLAYKLARTYGNNIEVVNSLNQYSSYFSFYEDQLKAEDFIDKSYQYSDSVGYQRGKAYALSHKSAYAMMKKNYKQAIIYSDEDLEISISENNKIGMERSYYDLGIAYRKLKQPKQAIEYFKKSLVLTKELKLNSVLASRYLELSNTYSDIKQTNEAFEYYKEYSREKMKDVNLKQINEFAQLEAKYIYNQQKTIDSIQSAEQQKTEIKHQLEQASTRFWKYTSVFIGVFGLFFAGIIVVLRRKREQVELGRLKNEMLQKEIKYKQKDISDFALNISRNQKWRKELLAHIKKLKKINSLQNDTSFKALEKTVIDRDGIDKHTVEFQNKVDILNTAFYEKLQKEFPSLTKTEIKLCSFIRLNIDNNEIAILQNVAVESVYTSRFRLRKKLNLSSNEDLNVFLNKF